MVRKRGTRPEVAAKWRKRLDRWQQRQDSISEFCRREGVSQASFFLWRKRLASSNTQRSARLAPVRPRGSAFIPVEVVTSVDARRTASSGTVASDQHASIEITLGEVACRIPTQVDEPTLRRIVRVLCEEATRC